MSEISSAQSSSTNRTSSVDMSSVDVSMGDKVQWNQMGPAEKEASVHQEVKRMQGLPANSSYVTHRLRVLNKILHLLSTQRTISQDQELELLFAGLSL